MRLLLCVGLLLTPCITGCGSGIRVVPVSGVVTYKGEPLKSGSIVFYPVDPAGRSAIAKIGPDGRFVPTTLQPDDGLTVGDYKVSVTSYVVNIAEASPLEVAKLKNGGLAIPKKYTEFGTSGLTLSIAPTDSSREVKFDLTE